MQLPEDFNELVRGFMESRAVLTALELNLFTAIGSGTTASEVAAKTGTDARATEMLLNALVSLELLEKRDNRFFNGSVAAQFLTDTSPDNARTGLMHIANLWNTWSTLTECVRAGTSVASRQTTPRSDDATRAFIAAMDHNASERAPLVVRAVGNDVRRMLDLGGGSGAYSIAFAKANPEMTAEVFDTSAVLPLTQEYVRKAGLESRISTRCGDLRTDSFGSGYDLIFLSAIAHMFSPDENRSLLRRACDALVPGGKLVLQDFILEPDKTAPKFAAIFSLNMLVNTEGGASYSEAEYTDWLHEAGFTEVRHVLLPGLTGLMISIR
jgi:SAM-dependent methyltransferase